MEAADRMPGVLLWGSLPSPWAGVLASPPCGLRGLPSSCHLPWSPYNRASQAQQVEEGEHTEKEAEAARFHKAWAWKSRRLFFSIGRSRWKAYQTLGKGNKQSLTCS